MEARENGQAASKFIISFVTNAGLWVTAAKYYGGSWQLTTHFSFLFLVRNRVGELWWNVYLLFYQRRTEANDDDGGKNAVTRCGHFVFLRVLLYVPASTVLLTQAVFCGKRREKRRAMMECPDNLPTGAGLRLTATMLENIALLDMDIFFRFFFLYVTTLAVPLMQAIACRGHRQQGRTTAQFSILVHEPQAKVSCRNSGKHGITWAKWLEL